MNFRHLDTLRRHAFDRPGFRLVNYAEIALPFYVLTLDALVQSRKPLPAIDEFILASIGAGVGVVGEISEFLGLETSIIERTVLAQWNLDHIDERSKGETRELTLTPQGQRTLDELEAIKPERMELTIPFDRLLWGPVRVHPADLVRPIEVRDSQIVETRAVHPHRPGLTDISVETVNPVLRELMRSRDINLDLLSILAVTRTDRRYLSALLLVYQGSNPSDVDVAVSVDGRISQPHTTALNRAGGLSWLELDLDTETDPLDEFSVDPALVKQLQDEVGEMRLQARLAQAEAAIALDGGDSPDEEEGVSDGLTPRDELSEAQAALEALLFRRVPVFEHPMLLRDALRNARERLLIISPWIKKGVVDEEFLDAVETLTRRKVVVTIAYGLQDPRFASGPTDDVEAVRSLEALERRSEHFQLIKLGNTHEKILIWDGNWVTTSFNWLSFRGDPRRTIRREAGFLVKRRDLVDEAYTAFIDEMEPPNPTPPGPGSRSEGDPRAWSPEEGFQ